MPRFPIASRDAVPPEQVDAFDAIVSARGGVVPEFGPIAVQLHVPEIAQRGEVLRDYLRAGGSTLPDNVAGTGHDNHRPGSWTASSSGTPTPPPDGGQD